VTSVSPANKRDLDRHFRRAVWLGAAAIAIAAAIVHSSKAADRRSAFIRWRPQVLEFWHGINIYETRYFPNPPILPITLTPLMTLPPVTGAMCWFVLKIAFAAISVLLCFQMVKPEGRALPSWFQAGVLFFCLRPFLSDLHHGNNNLLILFLVVCSLESWRRGHDLLAGLLLALSISYKVTPALFVFYFMMKGSWRIVGATALGMVLFLFVVPSAVVGMEFNNECLRSWCHHMLSPFLTKGASSPQEINQSMVGVLTRLLTETKTGDGRYDLHIAVNFVSLPAGLVKMIVKAASVLFVGMLVLFCRTKAERRTDPRLLGEFALVVLTMLFLSERSWKHHYVTMLLPFTYLMAEFTFFRPTLKTRILTSAAMWLSMFCMATTSRELGSVFGHRDGPDIAQAYGMFLWAGMVLYIATAWRVVAARNRLEGREADQEMPGAKVSVPAPHFASGERVNAQSCH
jgi:alpha-1,2-mannosyltransferase